ncbi:MAG: hypothetical protein ACAI38_14040 [Myxococcota bacterium]|nr:hypothetical protein [Myxococcota bacterium]
MTSDIRLSSVSNRTPDIWPSNMVSPMAAPFITMVNKLFSSQGPLSSYELQSIELKGSHFTIGVPYGWQAGVQKAVGDVIRRHAAGDVNTQGWTFEITDTSNNELPRG